MFCFRCTEFLQLKRLVGRCKIFLILVALWRGPKFANGGVPVAMELDNMQVTVATSEQDSDARGARKEVCQ